MTTLHFCPVPDGTMPLYVSQRPYKILEAVLYLDLLTGRAWFDPSDPFHTSTANGGLRVMSWGFLPFVFRPALVEAQRRLQPHLERILAEAILLGLEDGAGVPGWDVIETVGCWDATRHIEGILGSLSQDPPLSL